MPTPFPGMDPYLERPGLWRGVHTQLIVDLGRAISRQVRPRYSVSIEERSYVTLFTTASDTGISDVMVVRSGTSGPALATASVYAQTVPTITPILAELPMPEEVIERYLEVREVTSGEIITAIEILSPTNKSTTEGRLQYQQKRAKVLGSKTHLVEIDLLRAGKPMEMQVSGKHRSHYRIVVSRSQQRPQADLYLFSIQQAIPALPIPLQHGEPEPLIDLNGIFHELYDALGYDLKIDYHHAADPPLRGDDALWADRLLRQSHLRGENGVA